MKDHDYDGGLMSAGRLRPVWIATLAILALVPLQAPAQSATDSTTPRPPRAAVRLERQVTGREALDTPGLALDSVAEQNKMSETALRELLASDPDVHISRTGRLFYLDSPPPAPSSEQASAESAHEPQGPFPYPQTFLLHSRPAAQRVIYLDFDGYVVTNSIFNDEPSFTIGTSWNATAYDTDGNPGSFSNTEQDAIQSVWQRVAEDYAPFDVDVTTQDPGYAAINRVDANDSTYGTRAVITSVNSSPICSCGGIAFIDVFNAEPSIAFGDSHDYLQPALVFKQNLASTKAVGEAASHEVGHNLGLRHDGNASTTYYAGQGLWAPIMGVGYSKPLTQWSKGEYSGANQTQDDLAIIQSGGAPLRSDDHANTRVSATALGSGPTLNATGVISTSPDLDVFSFTSFPGPLTINVNPSPVSPNLDTKLTLFDSAGNVIASSDPVASQISTDLAGGLSASISTTLSTAGTYYFEVDGVGMGSPTATGYSDYSSLGQYSIDATVPQGPALTVGSQTATSVTINLANGVGLPADQIVIAPVGAPDTTRTSWAYLNGTQTLPSSGFTSATVTLPLSGVGVYEARLFSSSARVTATAFTFGDGGLFSVTPARLLDTRPGGTTVDGQRAGIGKLTANQIVELQVAGRGGVPSDAAAAVLNITAVEPAAAGYVTAFPCGSAQPNASNLNFVANQTIPNLIATKVGANGKICLFTSVATHLLVDASGFYALTSSYTATDPTRLVDSRAGSGTFDNAQAGFGRLTAGQTLEVDVSGRAGVPADAGAAALNLTVADPVGGGYLTAYPCGQPRPNASNLNFNASGAIANLAIIKIGTAGKVCVYTSAPANLIVDLNGWTPSTASIVALTPSRLLDTRPAGSTADGQSARGGRLNANQVIELQVGGRVGVPMNAGTSIFTVTVAEPAGVGYITVFPCGTAQPNASNVNYAVGTTVANIAVSKLGSTGRLCLFSSVSTHLIVDITGYYPPLA